MAVLAAITCAVVGACGGADRTGDAAAAGAEDDTAAGAVTTMDTSAVGAGDPNATAAVTSGQMSDANIFALLHASNTAEIEAGRLSRQRAQGAQVRSFAQRMIDDHSAMAKEGIALAKQLNVTPVLPDSSLVEENSKALADLREQSGNAFDAAYAEQQIGAHERTLDLVNNAIGWAQKPELKRMLEKARSRIEAHLKSARQLEGQRRA